MSSTNESDSSRHLVIQREVAVTLPEDEQAIAVFLSDIERLIQAAKKNAGGANSFHTLGATLLGAGLGAFVTMITSPPPNPWLGWLVSIALGLCGMMALAFAHLLKVNLVEEIEKLKTGLGKQDQ